MRKGLGVLLATAVLLAGCGGVPSQGPAVAAVPVSPAEVEAVPEKAGPSAVALAYLEEIGLSGFEFGGGRPMVYKWTQDIKVQVEGSPSESDRAALAVVVEDLNELIAPLQVREVQSGGNVVVYYGDDSEFPTRLPGYTPGNRGYFQVRFDLTGRLTRSDILISTQVGRRERAHLLREELTQSLGLFRDSWEDEESIFYQGWTTVQAYTELDKAIIRLLYDQRVNPGMGRDQVAQVVSGRTARR